jgi:hypothetical protein
MHIGCKWERRIKETSSKTYTLVVGQYILKWILEKYEVVQTGSSGLEQETVAGL